jgi:hypothetical protein
MVDMNGGTVLIDDFTPDPECVYRFVSKGYLKDQPILSMEKMDIGFVEIYRYTFGPKVFVMRGDAGSLKGRSIFIHLGRDNCPTKENHEAFNEREMEELRLLLSAFRLKYGRDLSSEPEPVIEAGIEPISISILRKNLMRICGDEFKSVNE